MDTIRSLASTARVASPHEAVLNTECCYTFHNGFYDGGLLVDLSTFVGTVPQLAKGKLNVRICKERILKETEGEPQQQPTKLAIGVEGGFSTEKYQVVSTYSVVALDPADDPSTVLTELPYNDETKNDFPEMVIASVESVIHHAGLAIQQDLAAWQLEDLPVTKYYQDLPFVDNGKMLSPDSKAWKCEVTGATENLWLNLSDGFVGGGRQHWDGTGGSNGALDHYNDTGQLYPLVVKLGTISGDVSTADCYSYAADEDGPVKVPNLKELLARRGIHVEGLQKTVKSTAELEVELNANYAFEAITEAGQDLKPLSGPHLQGLQNLGNSCYMNSVLQWMLGGPVQELATRYGTTPQGDVAHHRLLQGVSPATAPNDLICQTTKVACALTSGVYAKPLDANIDDGDPRYRLAPRMFKTLIGKDHVDFCTAQQQDAAQFLQYFLEQLDGAELKCNQISTGSSQQVTNASHLFSFHTTTRMQCQSDGKVKYQQGAAETILSLRLPMDKAVVKYSSSQKSPPNAAAAPSSPDLKRLKSEDGTPVPTLAFADVLQAWANDHVVDDVRWAHLGSIVAPATSSTRLTNFPRYLIVQAQRYTLGPDWSPVKLEVELDVPDELDLSAFKAIGPAEGEDLVPDEEENAAAAVALLALPTDVDEAALTQLMSMGFSLNGSKRALLAVGGSNVEAATGWVFEHMEDPDFNDPVPDGGSSAMDAGPSSGSGVDEGVVRSLVDSLGCFTADQVRAALQETSGAPDRAADWLFSHMDDLDGAIAALSSNSASGGADVAAKAPLEDGPGQYVLTGLISHIGKHTGSGHYVAHIKIDNQWVIFNDEKVAASSKPPIEHAYLYLFQREDTLGAPLSSF